jgi:hypothetical protein
MRAVRLSLAPILISIPGTHCVYLKMQLVRVGALALAQNFIRLDPTFDSSKQRSASVCTLVFIIVVVVCFPQARTSTPFASTTATTWTTLKFTNNFSCPANKRRQLPSLGPPLRQRSVLLLWYSPNRMSPLPTRLSLLLRAIPSRHQALPPPARQSHPYVALPVSVAFSERVHTLSEAMRRLRAVAVARFRACRILSAALPTDSDSTHPPGWRTQRAFHSSITLPTDMLTNPKL